MSDKPALTLYERIRKGLVRVTNFSSPRVRFWASIDKDGPTHPMLGQCWTWLGGKTPKGYGQFTVARRNLRAHRFAYTLLVGEIPTGLCVLHDCDNPSCVNPAHLFPGTTEENQEDKFTKDRQAKGEDNGESVLTEGDVRDDEFDGLDWFGFKD